jgi:hypothetical protein
MRLSAHLRCLINTELAGGFEESFLVLCPRKREVFFDDILERSGFTELEYTHAHTRRALPVVVDVFQEMVEKLHQFVVGLRVAPEIKPLLPRVPTQPLLF